MTSQTAYEDARTKEEPVGSDAEHPAPPPEGELPEAPAMAEVPRRVQVTGTRYIRRVVELLGQVASAAHALHSSNVLHRDIKPGNIRLQPDGKTAVLMDLGLAKLFDDTDGALTAVRRHAALRQPRTGGRHRPARCPHRHLQSGRHAVGGGRLRSPSARPRRRETRCRRPERRRAV